jgi:hypothetical protein
MARPFHDPLGEDAKPMRRRVDPSIRENLKSIDESLKETDANIDAVNSWLRRRGLVGS